MRSICLTFKVHQPVRLRRFRFFEIGESEYYYNDYANEVNMMRIAENCYLPANKIILDLIHKNEGRFKVAFSISGTTIDQLKRYTPEVIEGFQELASTGCVEFLTETYSHSLLVLKNRSELRRQTESHALLMESTFGKYPKIFANTEMIYTDEIGALIAEMGFKAILTKGPDNLLKWRNPNFLYRNAINPEFLVLLKNQPLSDDIDYRFSDSNWSGWPLTANEFVSMIKKIPNGEKIVNLFLDYETFGEHQTFGSGIFTFLESFPTAVFRKSDFKFLTPSEVIEHFEPISKLKVPHPISWADEQRELESWLGNELQQEAFESLFALSELIEQCNDSDILEDWQYLQSSDHFYYMCTKYTPANENHDFVNPYDSPYEAFMNYMNVLNDFSIRLKRNIREHTTLNSNN